MGFFQKVQKSYYAEHQVTNIMERILNTSPFPLDLAIAQNQDPEDWVDN